MFIIKEYSMAIKLDEVNKILYMLMILKIML